MSKSFSNLYSGTNGEHKARVMLLSTQKQKAFNYAKSIFEQGTPAEKKTINTVTVAVDETTGKVYYGMNGGVALHNTPKNAIIFGDKTHDGLLPKTSLNRYPVGHCSEVDAINNALNDGAKIENLHLTTLSTTRKNVKNGKIVPKDSCANCTYAFKGKIKKNNTGWRN